MTCDDCLGPGLTRGEDGLPRVNTAPNLVANSLDCTLGVKVRLPGGVGLTTAPADAAAGQGLHQDPDGTLWVDSPPLAFQIDYTSSASYNSGPITTLGTFVFEDVTHSWTNITGRHCWVQTISTGGTVLYTVGNGDNFRTDTRVNLTTPALTYDSGWIERTAMGNLLGGGGFLAVRHADHPYHEAIRVDAGDSYVIRLRRRSRVTAAVSGGGEISAQGADIRTTAWHIGATPP